jgi:hypothetical protein
MMSLVAALAAPMGAMAQESLGDLARQIREQRARAGKKTVRVYTNDDLPARPQAEGPTVASGMSSGAATKEPSATRPAPIRPELAVAQKASNAMESAGPAETEGTGKQESPAEKIKTREYWQRKFKSARAELARAEEEQQLVEDELNLLQIQQTRELDPLAKQELGNKVAAKQSEVDAKRATTAQARKHLDDLEKEFKHSGAPEDWSKTE